MWFLEGGGRVRPGQWESKKGFDYQGGKQSQRPRTSVQWHNIRPLKRCKTTKAQPLKKRSECHSFQPGQGKQLPDEGGGFVPEVKKRERTKTTEKKKIKTKNPKTQMNTNERPTTGERIRGG